MVRLLLGSSQHGKPNYTSFRQKVPTSIISGPNQNPAPNCQCFCETTSTTNGEGGSHYKPDYNNENDSYEEDTETEYEDDDYDDTNFSVSGRRPNFNNAGFGIRKTSFLTSAPASSQPQRELFVKKTTKPAPTAERPAALGPFFVGNDFLTKPAPINFANGNDGMMKKSTKPAPVPRPAVLGPFFVGKDFLTKPAPINTAGSHRNNDDFNNERLFF